MILNDQASLPDLTDTHQAYGLFCFVMVYIMTTLVDDMKGVMVKMVMKGY